jgi:hypothetical protein
MLKQNYCHFCHGTKPNEDLIDDGITTHHLSCKVDYMKELELDQVETLASEARQQARDTRLLDRLQKTLKQKHLQALNWLLNDHRCESLEILSVGDVKGEKVKGSKWFRESTAIRHIYDDTSTCYWGDSYGGNIFMPIGKKRYLKVFISG